MSNFSDPSTPSKEQDVLIDALLGETALSKTGNSEFLSSVEKALDEGDVIPLPAPPRRRFTPLAWSGAIAAAIALAIFAGLSFVETNEPSLPFTVAKVENSIWPGIIGCGPDVDAMELKRRGVETPLSINAPRASRAIPGPLPIRPLATQSNHSPPARSRMLREVAATWETPVPASLSNSPPTKKSSGDWGAPPEQFSPPIASTFDIGSEISAGYITDFIFQGTTVSEKMTMGESNGALPPGDIISTSAFSSFSPGFEMSEFHSVDPTLLKIGDPILHSLHDSTKTDKISFGQNAVNFETYTFKDLLLRKLPEDTFSAISPIQLTPPSSPSAPTRNSQYSPLIDNPWASPLAEPLSTFSTDVDTASWTNLRAMIRNGTSAESIPNDAVRIEEMINYFEWDYPQPKGEHPFAFAVETAPCPWNEDHQLMRIGVQGKDIPRTERPEANLVFLLDVSGSMGQPNKLPLVKKAIGILVEELNEKDTVTIVVYAGAEGIALAPTAGRDQKTIIEALGNLKSGGSTNGGAGIKLAYSLAGDHFVENGINRFILCTDGDFNVGLTGREDLVSLVEEKAKSGTYLSVMGFGGDNLNDAMLEEITNRGNGNYFHIDTEAEARKVFLNDLMGTLVTIAKDVKIQVEFNPAKVAKYRLIGYANRKLEEEDFSNDEIDAGEIGSGHTVTALYEVIPGQAVAITPTLRYQKSDKTTEKMELVPSDEFALLKLRYKKPDSAHSILMTEAVLPPKKDATATDDFRFASSVALLGMKLRDRAEVSHLSFARIIALAESAQGPDTKGYRAEFLDLIRTLKSDTISF